MNEQASFRDLLAQAAALAVKQERAGTYAGAWCVADEVLNPTAETKAHFERITGIRDQVVGKG